MKFKIVLLFCVMTTYFSYGQYDWSKGKLVLRTGDTLNGYLKLPIINKAAVANSHKIRFRPERKAKTTRYDHLKVKNILFKDDSEELTASFTYIKTSKSKYQLFKILYNSNRIRLYARMVSEMMATPGIDGMVTSVGYYPTEYNEFYVQRKFESMAHPLIKVGPLTKSFYNNARKYFSDCPVVVEKLPRGRVNGSDILRIVEEYDHCKL